MKKIAQIILAVAIVALVYVIYDQISTPIRFEQEMKAKKAQVIDRIKDIRTAQRAFKSKYQRFTGSFDTLASFILNDSLELERKIVDEDDSVAMAMRRDQSRFARTRIPVQHKNPGKIVVCEIFGQLFYNFFLPRSCFKTNFSVNLGRNTCAKHASVLFCAKLQTNIRLA